jgi:hypothetical protein
MNVTRRELLAATGAGAAGVLAGCSGTGGLGSGGSDGLRAGQDCPEGAVATRTPEAEAVDGDPVAADERLHLGHDFGTLRDNVRSGGQPKDGIPSIEKPCLLRGDAADPWMSDDDVVFGVVGGGEARAYPRKILVQHEIVNDVLDGERIAVTYCPLTGTAMGFYRGGTALGVSGNLLNNNLVMYDRGTDSRWPQILGTAISGELEGTSLAEFRLVWTSWKHWYDAHPDTRVLSRRTGYARNYGADPYGGDYDPPSGYYGSDTTLFPRLTDDDRFGAKEIFVGARTPAGAAAFHKERLADAGTLTATVAGTPWLAVYDATLDTGYVYRNPDGESFEVADGGVRGPDGTVHRPADLPLAGIYAFDAMWFAWSGFYPDGSVVA